MICLPDNVLGELVGVLLLVHVAVRHQELLQMVHLDDGKTKQEVYPFE